MPLLTEFGATTDISTITDVMSLAEQAMVGWQYWAYCGCGDPTTTGPGAEQALVLDPHAAPAGANVDLGKLRALAVPYPAVVAGTPTSYHVARSSSVFTATWTTRRYGGGTFGSGARSRIAVPRVAYPRGYVATVTGGHVVSPADRPWLVVAQDAGASSVSVTVRPR
jgi:endoglycosylceramidase